MTFQTPGLILKARVDRNNVLLNEIQESPPFRGRSHDNPDLEEYLDADLIPHGNLRAAPVHPTGSRGSWNDATPDSDPGGQCQ